MCQIEFHTPAATFDKIPHPYPASRHVPEWLKQMPTDLADGGTVKRCPPFITAMTAGYIIPAPHDMWFEMSSQGEVKAYCDQKIVSKHVAEQYRGAPFAASPVLKFLNPWIVVTPPEYACMITGPVNRFEVPLMPLTGIVETGTYYKEVQLPMVCLLSPGQSFALPRGAPLIQVIPFKRDSWTSRSGFIDMPRRDKQQQGFIADPHEYKKQYWRKLEFS